MVQSYNVNYVFQRRKGGRGNIAMLRPCNDQLCYDSWWKWGFSAKTSQSKMDMTISQYRCLWRIAMLVSQYWCLWWIPGIRMTGGWRQFDSWCDGIVWRRWFRQLHSNLHALRRGWADSSATHYRSYVHGWLKDKETMLIGCRCNHEWAVDVDLPSAAGCLYPWLRWKLQGRTTHLTLRQTSRHPNPLHLKYERTAWRAVSTNSSRQSGLVI